MTTRLSLKNIEEANAYILTQDPDADIGAGVFVVKTTCYACDGSGRWYGSSVAHNGGPCFKCGGRGGRTHHFTPIEYAKYLRKKELKANKQRRKAEAEAHRQAHGYDEWREAHPDEARLLDEVDHRIAKDMKQRLIDTGARWGLSEKQVALLKRLKEQVAERASETKVAAPVTDERIEVEGTVVSVKEGRFGPVMTVKVETDKGVWMTWGSVPSILRDTHDPILGRQGVRRGDKVRFVATIKVSDRDESFSFFKRPAKAEIVVA